MFMSEVKRVETEIMIKNADGNNVPLHVTATYGSKPCGKYRKKAGSTSYH